MLVKNFLNYKSHCCACGSILNTYFHSHKKQEVSLCNDNLLIKFSIRNKQLTMLFKIEFIINTQNNTFFVDFYHCNNTKLNFIPLCFIYKYKDVIKKQGLFRLFKICDKCNQYSYSSNFFTLNHTSLVINAADVCFEQIIFKSQNPDKLIRAINLYHINQTWFEFVFNYNSHVTPDVVLKHAPFYLSINGDFIKIPLINLNNNQSIITKLHQLNMLS
jgi:hypothetical protein